MIRTYESAVKFLEKYIPTPDKKYPGKMGLLRMQYLANLLGNPQRKYKTIHVGGTSGKGSVATIIASILGTKYKVGLNTSPHLEKITERIQLGSDLNVRQGLTPIPDNAFVALLNEIQSQIEQMRTTRFGSPSHFEIMTAMVFLYFFKKKVDVAVVEVGLGGSFDATNIINPIVAVLTNVGLDHTQVLGDTVEKIAMDKAGIIKRGIEVVSGVRQDSVIKIIKEKCEKEGASLSLLVPSPRSSARQFLHHPRSPCLPAGRLRATSEVFPWLAFSYRIKKITSKGSVFDYFGGTSGSDISLSQKDNQGLTLSDLRLSLLGEHQVENAALAIRAVEMFYESHFDKQWASKIDSGQARMTEKEVSRGLKNAFIAGRMEIVRRNPLVVLDGAHNRDKIKALVDSMKRIFPNKKVRLLMAIKNDKDAREMIRFIVPICESIILTSFRLKGDIGEIGAHDPEKLKKIIYKLDVHMNVTILYDAKKAYKQILKGARRDDIILVTGSLYLVGEIRR